MVFVKSQYCNIYQNYINLFALVILCFFLVSCNKKETQTILTPENNIKIAQNAVNINNASVAELEKLPNIGVGLAQNIVTHREKYGQFRKPEHLILVKGISDKRFRQLQNLVKTE